jgi:hypothetical protein
MRAAKTAEEKQNSASADHAAFPFVSRAEFGTAHDLRVCVKQSFSRGAAEEAKIFGEDTR